MAVTGAAIAANQASGNPAKRVGAYMKAHWKELLALVLAAIPALFILFHAGARKQAQQILTLAPTSGASPADSTTPPTTPPTPPPPPKPPIRDDTKPTGGNILSYLGLGPRRDAGAVSQNGYNPRSGRAPQSSSAAGVPPDRWPAGKRGGG